MPKYPWRIACVCIVLCLALLLCAACGTPPTSISQPTAIGSTSTTPLSRPQSPRIQSLRYHYWDGWSPDYIYIVESRNDVGLVAQSGWDRQEGVPEWQRLFKETQHSEFIHLLDTYDVWNWNGFDESEEIMDAGAIHIYIMFESGEELIANGFACFPENFYAANQAILGFFTQIADSTDYVPVSTLPTGAIP